MVNFKCSPKIHHKSDEVLKLVSVNWFDLLPKEFYIVPLVWMLVNEIHIGLLWLLHVKVYIQIVPFFYITHQVKG